MPRQPWPWKRSRLNGNFAAGVADRIGAAAQATNEGDFILILSLAHVALNPVTARPGKKFHADGLRKIPVWCDAVQTRRNLLPPR
jgi:hypothetical protein